MMYINEYTYLNKSLSCYFKFLISYYYSIVLQQLFDNCITFLSPSINSTLTVGLSSEDLLCIVIIICFTSSSFGFFAAVEC